MNITIEVKPGEGGGDAEHFASQLASAIDL